MMSSDTASFQLTEMLVAIIFFHVSEYILAACIHGNHNVSLSSLLISKQYILAMGCSLVEYTVETIMFPGLKEHSLISNFGLVTVIVGEIIRKLAVLTAGRAFTHLIRVRRDEQHRLVKNGVYRLMRHPGYCGFFLWAVGMQIMVCNPVCCVAFAIIVWVFFARRIPYEEHYLREFFGEEYVVYSICTFSGIPFVK